MSFNARVLASFAACALLTIGANVSHSAELTELDEVREADAYHIMVKTEAEAQDVYTQLSLYTGAKLNEQFAALAKVRSFDRGSSRVGGHLGPLLEGTMVPEFDQAIYGSPVNKVLAPFKSRFGWHIAMIKSIKKSKVTDVCNAAFESEIRDAAEGDQAFARQTARPLRDIPPQQLVAQLGKDWYTPTEEPDGNLLFTSKATRREDANALTLIDVHIEAPLAKLIPTKSPASCYRSYMQTYGIDCSTRRVLSLKRVGYAARANVGYANLIYKMKPEEAPGFTLPADDTSFEPFAKACSTR